MIDTENLKLTYELEVDKLDTSKKVTYLLNILNKHLDYINNIELKLEKLNEKEYDLLKAISELLEIIREDTGKDLTNIYLFS